MVRKLKDRKLGLRKRSIIEIEDGIEVPIRTLSIAEEASIKIDLPAKIPTKISVPSETQKQELKLQDPNYKPELFMTMKIYDVTSKEYINAIESINNYSSMLEALKYIDFKRKIKDEDGTEEAFYKTLGLSDPDNWLEICRYFDEEGFHEGHASKILIEAKRLRGETIFEKIAKLQQHLDMDYIELLSELEIVAEKRQSEKDKMGLFKQIQDEIQKQIEQENEKEESKLSIKENDRVPADQDKDTEQVAPAEVEESNEE